MAVNCNHTGVTLPNSHSKELTTIDIHHSEAFHSNDKMEERTKYKPSGILETNLDEESLIGDATPSSISTDDHFPTLNQSFDDQNLPIYEVCQTYTNSSEAESPLQINESSNENNSNLTTSPATIHYLKPLSVSSTIFSFIMSAAFVCIVWLVVFMIFGYKGHAIAGVFIVLFIIGLLINTCFLKLYFRLRVFLGLSAAVAVAERQAAFHRQQQQQRKAQLALEKSSEKPPSYSSVVESPPSYSFLQFYRSKKSSLSVNTASTHNKTARRKQHKCPFCKREVRLFGICIACKSDLQRK